MKCSRCGAKTQLFLCQFCTTELRRQLLGLPTIIGYLEDVCVGNTRMTNEKVNTKGFGSQVPHFDNRATQLVDQIRCTLGQWATQIAKDHGRVISPPVSWHRPVAEYKHTPNDYAVFLAAHSNLLAKDPDVGELAAALKNYVARALTIINRRTPPQFCGPCPTIVSDHRNCTDCGHRPHECATRLMARRGAVEVKCPACGTVHGVQRLVNHLLARADSFRCTIPELHRVLRMLDEPVPLRTLYRWAEPPGKARGSGQLRPAGYLRPDNKRIGPVRHTDADKPVYRVSDARKQRLTKTEGRKRK